MKKSLKIFYVDMIGAKQLRLYSDQSFYFPYQAKRKVKKLINLGVTGQFVILPIYEKL